MPSSRTPRARSRHGRRITLLIGASVASVALAQVWAQAAPTVVRPPTMGQVIANAGAIQARSASGATAVRPPSMTEAINRALSNQTRATQIRAYVGEARAAAVAAMRVTPKDGLDADGLDPVRGAVLASLDAVGNKTWQGASAPTDTVSGAAHTVTINQTDSRALLSWNRFDVGTNTTVQFNQKAAGVAQPGWVAVNRIVGEQTSPTMILGSIKADGTVLILNQHGVIFGKTAQVNLHSLIASSLELGNAIKTNSTTNGRVAASLGDRNQSFLQNGLLLAAPALVTDGVATLLSGVAVNDGAPGVKTTSLVANPEGDVIIDRGASITAGDGGFALLAGPKVYNDGAISVTNGQASLQGGRSITYTRSTGAATDADPDVRGLIFATDDTITSFATDGGSVVNSGLIDSRTGYISLGTGLAGTLTNSGLLAATTSVSRNGKISLRSGTITLGGDATATHAGALVITPDASAETIPQGTAAAPAQFKTSVIDIAILGATRGVVQGAVTLGQNSLIYAPSATVNIGGLNSMASGAVIDVSGVKDVQIDASRNSLKISPLKRNELRDTPNYRDPRTDGGFTLNGATVYVDPRLSGVRSDGVAWIGSPLIEAGSAASQVGIGASEFMTKGGTVSLTGISSGSSTQLPFTIDRDATIDISGGFVHYNGGLVRTSKLLTADGRIVDIGKADPNDNFVAVGDGFTEVQAKFGVSTTYANSVLQGAHVEEAYDEGRDAGALIITSQKASIPGHLYGEAFAGARQRSDAVVGTGKTSIAGDNRHLQAARSQLPAGGLLTLTPGRDDLNLFKSADIIVYHGSDPNALNADTQTLLSDSVLNAAKLSGLVLQTSGGVTFAGSSQLALANGGALTVDAGRTIHFDGTVSVSSGTITASTYQLGGFADGSVFLDGSPYRADDDIPLQFGSATPNAAQSFDIVVNGNLSTAGRWVNDSTQGIGEGKAWLNGGSIALTVAPKIFGPVSMLAPSNDALDLSGSILINQGASLNVASGGYVSPKRTFTLGATGGNISLINETTYGQLGPFVPGNGIDPKTYLPVALTDGSGSVVPSIARSKVTIADDTISGFGFGGGGTFTLVSPDVTFASSGPPSSTIIPLDFIQRTGFGALDVTVNHSRLIPSLFDNGITGSSAFFDTTQFRIGAGQTLNLSQSLLPSLLDTTQSAQLFSLGSGSDVLSILTPSIPTAAWDQRAASLKLGGLTELIIDHGGVITGAAGASITTSKLLNSGTIVLHGGTITQNQTLQFGATRLTAVADTVAGSSDGLSAIFGGPTVDGRYQENELVNASSGLVGPDGTLLTNAQALTLNGYDRLIVFTGEMSFGEGVRLTAGSVTDLSGVAVYDPRARYLPSGDQLRTGKLYDGGTLRTSGLVTNSAGSYFRTPKLGFIPYAVAAGDGFRLVAAQTLAETFSASGAQINLSGISATFDQPVSPSRYAPTPVWSNGGTLSVLGGGTISGGIINARGGAATATGGTLEWLNPVLVQTTAEAIGSNLLAADQIGVNGAGFDSFVSRGTFTVGGDVSLALRKSVTFKSARPQDGALTPVTITALGDYVATITAPYVTFDSDSRTTRANLGTLGTGQFTVKAGAIDLIGATTFGNPFATVSLTSTGDTRLIGVGFRSDVPETKPYQSGQILAGGDLNFTAAQVYATTATGGLQSLIEGTDTVQHPFLIASTGATSTVRFARSSAVTPANPTSAGSFIRVLGHAIEQDGVLRAPLGRLDLGLNLQTTISDVNGQGGVVPATQTLTFGANSITSVSGAGTTAPSGLTSPVPYGTTTDGIEYFFNAVNLGKLTRAPSGELRMAGGSIDVGTGATVDVSGGGSVQAYEFTSGTGGSRDVLNRFNFDSFSANAPGSDGTGYQFADKRQVYAIVPVGSAAVVAAYDPILSADYRGAGGTDLYGSDAGKTVFLDAGPGVAPGEYLLLPAQYATLPGVLRLVENTQADDPTASGTIKLLDGSTIVGGTYGTAGTDLRDSTRRSFTVQTFAAASKYSKILLTDGTATFAKAATSAGKIAPLSPLDAARVILSPLNALRVAGAFTSAVPSGGRQSKVDVGGTNILISDTATETPGQLLLTSSSLNNLNAGSLVLGAQRIDNIDGTTDLNVLSTAITVDSGVTLAAPELVLAVGGQGSSLTIADGASLTATGTLTDTRAGDYLINSDKAPSGYDNSGVGSFIRVANGPERLVTRTGTATVRNTLRPSTLALTGSASLTGNTIALDTTRNFAIADTVNLNAPLIALSSDSIVFDGVAITQTLETKLAAASRLTLRSTDAVGFSAGTHNFHDLTIDATGLTTAAAAGPADLTINAGHVRLTNGGADLGACAGLGARACGNVGSALALNATELSLGNGAFHTYRFDAAATLTATQGIYAEGKGSFSSNAAAFNFVTPFLADRSPIIDPRLQKSPVDYQILSAKALSFTVPAGSLVAPTGNAVPGARIAVGSIDAPVASLSIDGTLMRATAGTLGLYAKDAITLTGAATLSTPGYTQAFGEKLDQVTVSAGGGAINVKSASGDITIGAASRLISDTGIGSAGSISLLASNGAIALDGLINPGVASTTARDGSFAFDAGTSAFDLGGFVTRNGAQFGGDISIRTGAGSLALSAGQVLKARSVTLTADGGRMDIGGTINTSGVTGGAIGLYANDGLTLTGLLDAHSDGYADTDTRKATAGDVTLGVGGESAALMLATGSKIDVGARRLGNRLVGTIGKDPITLTDTTYYTFAEADTGGLVTLRAPVLFGNTVNIHSDATITGASAQNIEGFRRYDLNAIAASGDYSGITADPNGTIHLNTGTVVAGKANFLGGATGPVIDFIQHFNVSAADGSSLAGFGQKPGLEFNALTATGASGNIILDSIWNLGAGAVDFSDNDGNHIPDVVDAGLMRVSPIGANRYEVVPGKESELFQRFVSLTYRVGGSVSGLAPTITVRAGNKLDIRRSISDGFFTFTDRTDPDYMNYQLGGGDRTFHPAMTLSCGLQISSCDGASARLLFAFAQSGTTAFPGAIGPYNAFANAPNAREIRNLAGDPLGSADLFPLIARDALHPETLSAVDSSSLRLVAGAGGTLSANPLTVNTGSKGSVIVEGETSYTATVAAGRASYDGTLQFLLPSVDGAQINPNGSSTYGNQYISVTDFKTALDQSGDGSFGGLDGNTDSTFGFVGLNRETEVTIALGNGSTTASADARAAAACYFFSCGASVPGQITAPLSQVLDFLLLSPTGNYADSYAGHYAAGVQSGAFDAPVKPAYKLQSYGGAKTTYVRSLVRTGVGSINVAAANNVDLQGAPDLVLRRETGATASARTGIQVGGTAIYTAGHLIIPQTLTARIVGTNTTTTVVPSSLSLIDAIDPTQYRPNFLGLLAQKPTLAGGGGDVSISAGNNVLGRRDEWANTYQRPATPSLTIGTTVLWQPGQAYAANLRGPDGFQGTEILSAPQYFSSGVGALAGGDVAIHAGSDVRQLTVSLDSTLKTGDAAGSHTLITYGGGSLTLSAGRDVLGGQIDIAAGAGTVTVGRDVTTTDVLVTGNARPQALAFRLSDSRIALSAGGTIRLGGIAKLNDTYYSALSSVAAQANGNVILAGDTFAGGQIQVPAGIPGQAVQSFILPASFALTSLTGDIDSTTPSILYPSPVGQLSVLANGNIDGMKIVMSDVDPALFAGWRGATPKLLGAIPNTSELDLRAYHNEHITHAGDTSPVRIAAGGSITNAVINLAKAARISAGVDIVNLFFDGQNVAASDVTRITAGRDITATTSVNAVSKLYYNGNNIVLGGPGALFVEAGHDLGPFLTSSEIYAGGVRTIGNDENPWLTSQGAKLYAFYGAGNGIYYDRLATTYLDPATTMQLDGDLFAQNTDKLGNKTPDRSKPIYAPILAQWLLDNFPESAAAALGTATFASPDALSAAAYGNYDKLYAAFLALPTFTRAQFLVDKVYFNELNATANPDGNSYLQYIRGYRAVDALFPASAGYTDNLSTFYTDPATITTDHPLGQPAKILANPFTNEVLTGADGKPLTNAGLAPKFTDPATGASVSAAPLRAVRVITGNADLRLAAVETARGGDLTILGPGGDFIAGSVVRTAFQKNVRATSGIPFSANYGPFGFSSIAPGYEGILTLRGGGVRSFTDGDFRLNQSRLFTVRGGDITMWSSNGDLNAGQGPKSASNFPPITVRFDLNGLSEVDSAGSVSGAGIGAFQPSPDIAPPNVTLIAPVGEVDAGDAGVRAGGDIFVAAARVANADNFKAGGKTVGVPTSGPAAQPTLPKGADVASHVTGTGAPRTSLGQERSRITVEVLHFADDKCTDANGKPKADCAQ